MLRRIFLSAVFLVVHALAAWAQPALIGTGTSGSGSVTAFNTTGANFIVIAVATDGSAPNPSVSDSPGNTYTALTSYGGGSPPWNRTRLYYATNPTTSATHGFTVLGTNRAVVVAAFSGVATTTPFQSEAGASFTTGTSAQGGTVTPSGSYALVISAMGHDASRTFSIDSSFTIAASQGFNSGINYGASLAYKAVTPSSGQNPTWSWTTNTSGAVANAVFTANTWGGATRRVIVVGEDQD